MNDRRVQSRYFLSATCVLALAFLSSVEAQTPADSFPVDSREFRDTDIPQRTGGHHPSPAAEEVTAEELKRLQPADTAIGHQLEQAGIPLSTANRPRTTATDDLGTGTPIARNTEHPQETTSGATKGTLIGNKRDRSAGGWFSLRDFLPLAVVLALILALAWIIKRYRPAQAMLGGGGVLEVVARLPVSSKQTLLLVRMGRQLVLLGQSQDRLTMLTELHEPEQVSSIIGETASRTDRSLSHEFARTFESESALYERDLDLDPAEQARGHVHALVDRVRHWKRSREVA